MGMSLQDYMNEELEAEDEVLLDNFAAQVMPSLLAQGMSDVVAARRAYEIANALLNQKRGYWGIEKVK